MFHPRDIKAAQAPLLTGDFARAAYDGALRIADLAMAAPGPDPHLAVLAGLHIHAAHHIPYVVADAGEATGLGTDDLVLLVARLVRHGLVRRAGAYQADAPLNAHDRLDIPPARRAGITAFFARACTLGSDALPDWRLLR